MQGWQATRNSFAVDCIYINIAAILPNAESDVEAAKYTACTVSLDAKSIARSASATRLPARRGGSDAATHCPSLGDIGETWGMHDRARRRLWCRVPAPREMRTGRLREESTSSPGSRKRRVLVAASAPDPSRAHVCKYKGWAMAPPQSIESRLSLRVLHQSAQGGGAIEQHCGWTVPRPAPNASRPRRKKGILIGGALQRRRP
ncbi:hypothetical protein B0H14DRAFT_2670743 [Mycena olivaceomarginata]|nr:hypothetical protein B0H14DRAFT_2670743 [Mycena olivaceomarginata]